jgi:hypothetical protein
MVTLALRPFLKEQGNIASFESFVKPTVKNVKNKYPAQGEQTKCKMSN